MTSCKSVFYKFKITFFQIIVCRNFDLYLVNKTYSEAFEIDRMKNFLGQKL